MNMDTQGLVSAIEDLGIVVFPGYPGTQARAPYVVVRPMIFEHENISIGGEAVDWDHQFGLYCVGGSVDASFNLARMVVSALDGSRMGDSTMSLSVGYVGAQVEGNYETQITTQSHQGGI